MTGYMLKRLYWGIGLSGLLALLASGTPIRLLAQFATSDRISQPGFWPTQKIYPRDSYAGPRACANCHAQISNEAAQTAMAHTAMLIDQSDILKANPNLSFDHGSYHYEIRTSDGKTVYTVTHGAEQKSARLAWAFGTNLVAQSWLFHSPDGQIDEVRVTYFLSLHGLGFTPGREVDDPEDIDEAMYREVGRAEVYKCFSCHTTASGMGSSFDEARLISGVTCEACHGPGRAHIDTMDNLAPAADGELPKENTDDAIFDPGKLTPEESVDFCGSCHGSYWDISLSGSTGVNNVRFQPYRLEESRCWNKDDSRLTCIACHDPHKRLDTTAADYDHVCLSCHLTKMATMQKAAAHKDSEHPGAACPVATKDCTTCHMPEVYVPAMHRSFPDHRIRIAREGEPFPD